MQKVVATMVHEARFLEELSRSRAIGHRDHSQYWQKSITAWAYLLS